MRHFIIPSPVNLITLAATNVGQKETGHKETGQKETRQKEIGQKVLHLGQKVSLLK